MRLYGASAKHASAEHATGKDEIHKMVKMHRPCYLQLTAQLIKNVINDMLRGQDLEARNAALQRTLNNLVKSKEDYN